MEDTRALTLEQMQNVDIRVVDRDALRDIGDVTIDTSLPRDQRLLEFIKQIGNPYCYRCGKAVVKVRFADTERTLEDRLEEYLKSL